MGRTPQATDWTPIKLRGFKSDDMAGFHERTQRNLPRYCPPVWHSEGNRHGMTMTVLERLLVQGAERKPTNSPKLKTPLSWGAFVPPCESAGRDTITTPMKLTKVSKDGIFSLQAQNVVEEYLLTELTEQFHRAILWRFIKGMNCHHSTGEALVTRLEISTRGY